MIGAALLLLMQSPPSLAVPSTPTGERLGPGPHTLVISDGKGLTRIDYKTGAACQKARDETRRQVAPPPSSSGVYYGRPSVKAFCVPR